ncbi:glycosyltransferase family 4 protein [Sphingomicrobium sediminis]|uniref:Glycosyltransferase family 4 protein n=1 Tax=Sphingomicrobium sediminis TaxID=2950949 RepID=A0A9X2EH88_9SPHN|nr:glycosyltransferase family 4 protein [Sphingomicrobium sediminis]MCM8556636.1 glycosyltransferase family 4 protein [Sphingomicrobium sediminis]
MRLLYLTQWFEPEPVMKGIRFARALADAGHDVEVATAFPNYPRGKVYDGYKVKPYQRDEMQGLTLHRLWVYPSHDGSTLRRMLTYCSFFVSALIFMLIRGRRYDFAYVYHAPIMPGFATALAYALYRRPFILEIQDLWPDSVMSSGMAPGLFGRILNWICNFVYRRAKRIVAQSEGMKQRLIERGVLANKVSVLRNWSNYVERDDTALPASFAEAFEGRTNFVYGGNLGQAQSLDVLIEAASIAADEQPGLHLHLFGWGMDRDRLVALAKDRAPDHVTIHDAVAPEVADKLFEAADILVFHLDDDPLYDITIPSKTQHYLSVGKPIVAGLSGEAATILESSDAALVTKPGDVEAMAKAFVQAAALTGDQRAEKARKARGYYQRELAFEPAMARILDWIEKDAGK